MKPNDQRRSGDIPPSVVILCHVISFSAYQVYLLRLGSIEAEVYSVMPAGSETTIYLEVGGERILSKQNGLKQYSPDQKVWLRINPDKMNVFCKDSGRLAKLAVMDAQQDKQNSIK